MKQKLFSLGDDFTIRDESGNDVYFVDGKAMSIGNQLSFQDAERNELAFIKQRVLSWGATYEISRAGQVVAVVKQQLTALIHHRFMVDAPGSGDLEIEGNLTDHEYRFHRGDATVATVSKKWLALADTYSVDVEAGEDPVLVLACTVVVDEACHPDGRRT
ncbi:MAG: LURP-one-related family protein [Gemmatimonadota bacterium]|nr:LURP-one-related family protein [Gemmatimonadota bacterium]